MLSRESARKPLEARTFVPSDLGSVSQKLKYSLLFSLLTGKSPRRRPVSQDCLHHHPRPRRDPPSGVGDFGRLHAGLSQGGVEFRSDRGVIWALRAGMGPRSLAAIFQFPRPSAGTSAEKDEARSNHTVSKREAANRIMVVGALNSARLGEIACINRQKAHPSDG